MVWDIPIHQFVLWTNVVVVDGSMASSLGLISKSKASECGLEMNTLKTKELSNNKKKMYSQNTKLKNEAELTLDSR